MPLLSHSSGVDIGQSAAINYYLAASLGFMGKNPLEGAQITAISEHLKEMNQAYRKIIPYGTEPTAEQNDKWFDGGADDASPAPAARGGERYLKWYMGRIEYAIGAGGFSVGSSISLADVLIYNTFAEFLSDEQANEGVAQYRREAFGSKARTDKALDAHPKLKAVCTSVAGQPQIQKWLATRGKQGF